MLDYVRGRKRSQRSQRRHRRYETYLSRLVATAPLCSRQRSGAASFSRISFGLDVCACSHPYCRHSFSIRKSAHLRPGVGNFYVFANKLDTATAQPRIKYPRSMSAISSSDNTKMSTAAKTTTKTAGTAFPTNPTKASAPNSPPRSLSARRR